jgi:hypothetical protein
MRKKYLMKPNSLWLLAAFAALPFCSNAQTTFSNQIALTDLSAFKPAASNWSLAGSVSSDFNTENSLKKKDGTGILVTIAKDKHEDIFTNLEHGDIDLSIDFLMPRGSNSGIYLQGRYEIQLADSWNKDDLTYQDLGAVYPRWDESRPAGQFAFEGVTPRLNVSRAPGLWQNIHIIFQAPKFDGAGKKTANARIVKIELNGVSIIENAELHAPTRGSAFPNEAATGPLRLQGDHGSVAFRNIKYNTTVATVANDGTKRREWWEPESPMYITVKDEPKLMRSFFDIPGKKRVTHAISAGYPHNVSYSYDLSKGTLFQVWRGGYLDATPMWNSRGDGNSDAIGSKVFLNDAPALAVLASKDAAWPDTISKAQAFSAKGYELDEKGYPTYKYITNGLHVDDKIAPNDGQGLVRTLTINGQAKDLYFRAATGNDIVDGGDGLYSINSEYYIKLDKGVKPVIRTAGSGKELLIPVNNADKGASVQYSLIW